jgi:hypothetical protein
VIVMSSMASPGSPVAGVGHKHEPTTFGAWRTVAIVISALIALLGFAALAGATAAVVLDQTQRGHDGYLSTGTTSYSTGTYALVSDSYRAGTAADWFAAREILGKVRITVTSSQPVFLGVAPAAKADSYLAGIRREQGPSFEPDRFGTASHSDFQVIAGGAPRAAPTKTAIWAASTTGAGTHTLVWAPKNGEWRVVLMNADASAGINADMSIGAKFPHLLAIGLAVGGIGLLLLLASAAGLIGALQPRGRP